MARAMHARVPAPCRKGIVTRAQAANDSLPRRDHVLHRVLAMAIAVNVAPEGSLGQEAGRARRSMV